MKDFKPPRDIETLRGLIIALLLGFLCFVPALDAWISSWSMP